MTKKDGFISFIIGLFIGIFFASIINSLNLKIPYLYSPFYLVLIFPFLSLFGIFIASEIGKKFLAIKQLAKFMLVGALNTFVDLGVLNLLMVISGISSGIYYSVFKGFSFIAATSNSYIWNKHWTFEKGKEVFSSKEYSQFLIVAGIGFLINVSIASFLVNGMGAQYNVDQKTWGTIAAVIAALCTFVWNFIGAKFVVFKK